MIEFFKTGMGKRFFEGTMPAIAEALEKLNKNLENIHKRNEQEFNWVKKRAVDVQEEAESWEPALQKKTLELMDKALTMILDAIFSQEIAGHFPFAMLEAACEIVGHKYPPEVASKSLPTNLAELCEAVNEPISVYCVGKKLAPQEIADLLRGISGWCEEQAEACEELVAPHEAGERAYCTKCDQPFTEEEKDGGRCLSCGKEIP